MSKPYIIIVLANYSPNTRDSTNAHYVCYVHEKYTDGTTEQIARVSNSDTGTRGAWTSVAPTRAVEIAMERSVKLGWDTDSIRVYTQNGVHYPISKTYRLLKDIKNNFTNVTWR